MSSECARELLMSGVHLAREAVQKRVSDSHPKGTNFYTEWTLCHCKLRCYFIVYLPLKGRAVPWWQALLDLMGPFCTMAQSTLELMQQR